MKDDEQKDSEIEAWEMPPPKKRLPESEADNETAAGSIYRRSFREPVNEGVIKAVISETPYELNDIGSRGIGISVDNPDAFTSGKVFPVNLQIEGKSLALYGRVVHVSPDPSEKYLCGIELINLEPDDEKSIQVFIQHLHTSFFAGK